MEGVSQASHANWFNIDASNERPSEDVPSGSRTKRETKLVAEKKNEVTSDKSNPDTELINQPLDFTLKSVDHCVYEVNQSSHPRFTSSYGVNCGRFDKEIMFASLSGYFVNRLKVLHGY